MEPDNDEAGGIGWKEFVPSLLFQDMGRGEVEGGRKWRMTANGHRFLWGMMVNVLKLDYDDAW